MKYESFDTGGIENGPHEKFTYDLDDVNKIFKYISRENPSIRSAFDNLTYDLGYDQRIQSHFTMIVGLIEDCLKSGVKTGEEYMHYKEEQWDRNQELLKGFKESQPS